MKKGTLELLEVRSTADWNEIETTVQDEGVQSGSGG